MGVVFESNSAAEILYFSIDIQHHRNLKRLYPFTDAELKKMVKEQSVFFELRKLGLKYMCKSKTQHAASSNPISENV